MFLDIIAEENKRGTKQEEASKHAHIRTHHYYFFYTSRPWRSSAPPLSRLYLGPQPRYKPSGCSDLSPTPFATNRYPPIISSHHGLPLCRPFSTLARNQLFIAACKPFEAFARCLAILLLLPAFELFE
jgi:hypothetical protein